MLYAYENKIKYMRFTRNSPKLKQDLNADGCASDKVRTFKCLGPVMRKK
jgi:hypothetical protein